MAVTRRYTIHAPQLVGRVSVPKAGEEDVRKVIQRFVGEWDGAMQELQRFLKYLMDISDVTQENITNVDNSITNVTNVLGAVQFGGVRPIPHTHAKQDVEGLLVDHDRLHLHQHPHTHGDLAAMSSSLESQVALSRPKSHTHDYGNLVGSQLALPNGSALRPVLNFSGTGFATNGFYTESGSATINVVLGNVGARYYQFGGAYLILFGVGLLFGDNVASNSFKLERVAAGTARFSTTSASMLLIVKAGTAQAANLEEWQDSGGNVLSRIDKDGQTTDFVLAGQIFGP